jgi:uncharacterized protein YxeA
LFGLLHYQNCQRKLKEGVKENMKPLVFILIFVCLGFFYCTTEDQKPEDNYLHSNASYEELENTVGCDSKYSDDRKRDVFNNQYKNHWMIWTGEVVLVDADSVSLNIDGKGTQDLSVDFASKGLGYNLLKGQVITVKFLMKSAGGCILPFGGEQAVILALR